MGILYVLYLTGVMGILFQLQEANRTIARLKGEILKLSTEAQNAQNNGNTMDDAMIEENEELKTKVVILRSYHQ